MKGTKPGRLFHLVIFSNSSAAISRKTAVFFKSNRSHATTQLWRARAQPGLGRKTSTSALWLPRNRLYLLRHETIFRRNFVLPRPCFVSFRRNFVKSFGGTKRNEIFNTYKCIYICIYVYVCVKKRVHIQTCMCTYMCTCPCRTSLPHVYSACPSRMSMLHVLH